MNEIIDFLREAVELGKSDQKSPYPPHLKGMDGALELTQKALLLNIKPQDILDKALVPAMANVGQSFSENKIFVPQMLMSARAMSASMSQLKPFFASGSLKTKGTFIIGTVKGDLHDIGKNLVSMMVEGGGWTIKDLGVDVGAERFLQELAKTPDAIIGLSALLTTTMVNMQDIVATIKEIYPSAKILIGGAPVNMDFCQRIGADYYAPDPQKAVEYLNRLAS